MKIPESLRPYTGLLIFIVVLLASNYLWKFLVKGDDSNAFVSFLGVNISAPFNFLAQNITSACYKFLRLFGSDVILLDGRVLMFPSGNSVRIDWSCTALKQTFIFICIMLASRGNWGNKMWFILLGVSAMYLFNIFRIACIAALVANHFEWFDFLHRYFFKTLFYALILLLWIIWEEKYRQKTKETEKLT